MTAISAAREQLAQRAPRIGVRYATGSAGEKPEVGAHHADHAGWLARLQCAFGSKGPAFPTSQLNHLVKAAAVSGGKVDNVRLDSMLAVVDGAAPRNEIEAMLAAQMAVAHGLVMDLVLRAARADTIPQFEAAGLMATRLLRAFATHAETLQRLQRGPSQTVRVEHVHVHAGAQAVVGHVEARGGVRDGILSQPHAKALAPASEPPGLLEMRCQDPRGKAVPFASGEAPEALPDARRRAG